MVNRINTYVNPYGWLDLVLSITLTGPSSDYDEYIPPYPNEFARFWHHEYPEYDDTSDQYDSESDLSDTVDESLVIWAGEVRERPESSDDEDDAERYQDTEWYK